MRFNLFILASIALAALARPTADPIATDLTTLNNQLKVLDDKIVAFPTSGGSLSAASAIHSDALKVDSVVTQAIQHAAASNPASVTDAQIATIFAIVENFSIIVIKTLQDIANKKAAFQNLPIGGIPNLVKSDLNTLKPHTVTFEDLLIRFAKTAAQKDRANAIKNDIGAAFDHAITIYA